MRVQGYILKLMDTWNTLDFSHRPRMLACGKWVGLVVGILCSRNGSSHPWWDHQPSHPGWSQRVLLEVIDSRILIVSWNQLHHIFFGDVFNLLLYKGDFLSIYHGTMMTWDIPMVRRCFKSSKFESMFLLGRYLRSYNFCSSLFFFRKCLPGQVWKGFTSIHILIYNLWMSSSLFILQKWSCSIKTRDIWYQNLGTVSTFQLFLLAQKFALLSLDHGVASESDGVLVCLMRDSPLLV